MLSTEAKLTEFVKRVREVCGGNLEAVILYGSAARGDFRPERSDLNLLCVLKSLTVQELGRVAPVVRWWSADQNEPAPLFFTKEELQQSADVFAIEILDIQDSQRALYGANVVADVDVPMNLHRVQVERDLRTVLLKLRQHFLRASGTPAELQAVMGKSFSGVLTLLRHTVLAFGEEPPLEAKEILARVAALTSANAGAFDTLLALRDSGELHGEIIPVYGAYLTGLEKVILALDRHVPKKEWRRVRSAQ